ncbi:hypothetical protein MLD38_011791 [Melastoma candidum]|uniref:Uncharacterized protein n=1 Tax=Melastoma candidum TaxID=119954 RepID=A0ACB9R4A6_9MYRT|nr:hypothetical protein MLD38_011791 [Melastoma candidum]
MKGAWKSTGRPSLTGFAEVKDAVAVRDWVHENVGVQSQLKNKLISALGRVEMHLIEGAGHFQMEGPGYE